MNKIEKKQIGLRIKRLREEKGYTQDDLAEKLKMKNRATISSYEAGRATPPSEVLRDLADIFNVSTDYLLGRGVSNEFADQSNGDVIDIGWAIKEERITQGLTQQELAEQVGVTQKDISQYERDIKPIPSDILETIVKVFGMSFPVFLVKYNMYDEYIPPHFDGDVDKYLAFKKAEEEDAMKDPGYDIQTIAAHHDDEDWTEDELEEIERFKEFVKSKRKQK